MLLADGHMTMNVYNAAALFLDVMQEEILEADGTALITPAGFSSRISTIENYIFANCLVMYDAATKTGNDAAGLLGACSIARNSYDFWYNSIFVTTHSWHGLYDEFADGDPIETAAGGWLRRAAADVHCFFASFYWDGSTLSGDLGTATDWGSSASAAA